MHVKRANFRAEGPQAVSANHWLLDLYLGDAPLVLDLDTGIDRASHPIGEVVLGTRNSFDTSHWQMDDLAIGTTGIGSSDVFADSFSGATIAPPFDSIVGSGISLSAGALLVDTAVDGYAVKAFADQTHLYAQFRINFFADIPVDFTGDFFEFWTAGESRKLLALYADFFDPGGDGGGWGFYGSFYGSQAGGVIPTDVWHTIGLEMR